ncbi:hypothetical protein NDN11_03590 [Acinetobacter sp. C26M]|uniref:hypothetical protein n=1 Tax=unclassified Acinetobacter TaxID=196816 RepID=UPI00141DA271|nr:MULTISPECIES: hypothetical protein [unclassified Acinetobacter]NIE95730.1 hypothetical protein [Acinetobacter sp. Tr-809]USA47218.1 hypothetical protein NDN11_03590 [Acinetobacter sp. C26M]USA50699.1 hypothetical protein NDN12_03590 [Acinetobacter sp. C26G]
MKHTLPTSSGLSKFIIFSIFVWLVLLWLQSTYIVVIGGDAYLFWTSLGLLVLNILSLRPNILKNRIALVITVALLIYLLFHSLFCTYLMIAFYCIFYLYSGEYKNKRMIKLISLFLIMIIFAIYQTQSLHELKSHYATYDTGETWQKYGAL